MKNMAIWLLVCLCSSAPGADGLRPVNPRRPAVKEAPPRRPNVIVIVADDLGYGDIGVYGQTKIKTPNLDKMALEGVRFTQFYAGAPVSAPSRASLMTGMHTGHATIRGDGTTPLAEGDLTVAWALRDFGYQTALSGKWGLGLEGTSGHPNTQGFHEWFGYLDSVHAHDYYPEFLWRNKSKFVLQGNAGGKHGDYAPDWITRMGLNCIRINADRPFFLFLSTPLPHANNELKDKGMQVPSAAPYLQEAWPEPEKSKAAMISRLDADVGLILNKLKELRMDEQTIVFFTSDNGPHREGGVDPAFFNSAGPLRGMKRDLYEGGIRVPMLVRWPGKVPAGKTIDQPWAIWDFLPTAVELAWGTPSEKMDGISMLPVLLGRPAVRQHDYLYWECHEGGFKQAIRMGQWKGVKTVPGQPLELFDLSQDIGEKENVADKNPEIVSKIEAFLRTARTDSAQWPVKGKSGN